MPGRLLDVNAALRSIEGLIRQSVVGQDIDLQFHLCNDECATVVDPRELSLSVLNLVMNARDAMPSGGTLTIKTECRDLPFGERIEDLEPGRYAIITVSDTGTGMSDEVLARAFEPFFTTKEIGKGTGLGLSQVYGIVKQSGGTVRLKSEVRQGSEVEIWLPEYANSGEAKPH
jgi:signal transduction histidine kinase